MAKCVLRLLAASLLAQPGLTTMHAPQAVAGGSGSNLLEEIKRMKREGETVCISLDRHYLLGGLANSLGIVNTILNFAMANNLHWKMPEILPPAHEIGDAFRFMFGEPEWCEARRIPMYIATCPFQLRSKSRYGELPEGHCNLAETLLSANTKYSFSQCHLNCSNMILVSSIIDWMFDYSETGAFLANRYWKRRAALGDAVTVEMEFPMATAVHLRLGDLEGTGHLKEFNADKFDAMKSALTSVIDPRCLNIELHTDNFQNSSTVQAVKKSWRAEGVANVTIYDVTTPDTTAFNRMASAGILMGGPSGFSRLAAVLSHAYLKLFTNDHDNSHPIEYVEGATTLDSNFNRSDVVTGLKANKHVARLIQGCNHWLD